MSGQTLFSLVTLLVALVGAVNGTLALCENKKHKTQNLRIFIRELKSKFNAALNEAASLLPHVDQSHQRVLGATGKNNSGVLTQWLQDHKASKEELDTLNKVLLLPESRYASLKLADLEEERSRLYPLNQKVNALIDRYKKILTEDDQLRERIVARHSGKH